MNSTCQKMEELSSSKFLKSSLLFTISTCVVLIPITYKATKSLWFSKLSSRFHRNLRLILQFNLFGFFIHGSARVVLHSIDLYNYSLSDPCQMIPNVWRCFWLRFIYAVGLWIPSTTVIPLVLERSIATKYMSSYEKKGIHIGILLVLLQCMACSVHLWILYSGSKIEGVVMTYCMVARDSSVPVGEINGYATIVVQIVARIIFEVLHRINRKFKRNNVGAQLSNRYQMEQNLLVMDNLKTFADISAIFFLFHAVSFMVVLSLKHHVSAPVYFALVELNSSYPLYGIVTILLMRWQLRRNRKKVHTEFDRHLNVDWKLNMTVYRDPRKKYTV